MPSLFGPRRDGSAIEFRLWAPGAARIDAIFPDRKSLALQKGKDGFWSGRLEGCEPGMVRRLRTIEPGGLGPLHMCEQRSGRELLVGSVVSQ